MSAYRSVAGSASFATSLLDAEIKITNKCSFRFLPEMARGSIGRERMLSGVVGINAHQPPPAGHQEDLNNELLAVSCSVPDFYAIGITSDRRTPANRRFSATF